MWGEQQVIERGLQASRLIHPRGKHHHGPFIEDDLQLKSVVLDGLEHDRLVRLPGRDDDPAHRNRSHAAGAQGGNKRIRWSLREQRLGVRRRLVEECAVFDDGVLEQVQVGTDLLQIIELAAGDEHEAPARGDQALQSGGCFGEDMSLCCEGAIVVGT